MSQIWAPLAEGQRPGIYVPGQFIYLQGTQADTFFYLVSGVARSFISSESGGERVLTVHRAGDLMGEASFFDERPRVSSAVALVRSEAISVDRERLNAVFRAHPDLALPMLQYLARTVRMVTGHVDDMSFLRADQRVARYLLSLPEEAEKGRLACTHEEIGFSVGVSRVTVSRVLGDFVRRGWVETAYRGVRLKDRRALQELADAPG